MVNIIIGFCILIIGVLGLGIYIIRKDSIKEKTKISFKEGLDLTELPIVTFYCNDIKLHFLLDTGSNISYIDESVLKTIPHQKIDVVSSTIGVTGEGIHTQHYIIEFGYKNQKFKEQVGAVDLSCSFDQIEKECGVKLHGILGSKFFERYKYILNFNELIAHR